VNHDLRTSKGPEHVTSTKPKTKKSPADYGPIQPPNHLGLDIWQFEAAVRDGLIPPADRGGRWSAAVIEGAAQRLPDIVAAVGDQAPLGANRIAARIAARLELDVTRHDVLTVVDRGLLAEVGEHKGWPTYDEPTRGTVRSAINADPELTAHSPSIVLEQLTPQREEPTFLAPEEMPPRLL
jgi:hypothetical protein